MSGYRFSEYIPPQQQEGSGFENLLKIFMQLLTITSGDVAQALGWMNELDQRYNLTDDRYGIGDFIEDLKRKGYLEENPQEQGSFKITGKSEQKIRRSALEEIFGKLKRGNQGNHNHPRTGTGDELSADRREYRFGDAAEQIAMTDSLRNAQINHGVGDLYLTEARPGSNRDRAQDPDQHCAHDRYFALHDPVWRRPDHACQKSRHGPG